MLYRKQWKVMALTDEGRDLAAAELLRQLLLPPCGCPGRAGPQGQTGPDGEEFVGCAYATKPAEFLLSGLCQEKLSLAMTYSHTIVRCTTIGVTAFHFCVRNGDRWDYSTMVARQICI